MIIVLGRGRVLPHRRDDALTSMRAMVEATRSDDGCISYTFAADVSDPAILHSVEVWRDQAALDAHMQHDHTAAFLAVAPDLLDGEPTVTIHEVTA